MKSLLNNKVLLVINEKLRYNYAPTSKYLIINEELRKKGFNSTLIGRESKDKVISRKKNIDVILPINEEILGNIFVKIQLLFKIINLLIKDKKIKKVIIRNNDPEMLVFLIPLIKILKRKAVYDFSGYLYKERIIEGRIFRAIIIKPLEEISLILSDKIILLSQGLKKILSKKLKQKTIILPTGLSSSLPPKEKKTETKRILKKYEIKNNIKIVGFIGNWEKWININDIIKCSSYLKRILFLIVGKGYKSNYYHYKSLNKKNLIFTGRVSHKEALILLKNMDVVVVPYKKDSPYSSIKDTFSSMKVKESLAFSKPIIVSNIKGKEGFLKNYENCLFYKPNNAKDLSKKISLLLKDRELYKKISKNSLKLSKKFYWSILLEKSGLINYLKNG
jgi:glycosyltransferase involved in cell wall biosynthesis